MKRNISITSQEKTAFLTALITGFAVHLFILTNSFHNYDNVHVSLEGVGSGASSGRGVLHLIYKLTCDQGWCYNLPYFNNLIFLLLLAASSVLLTKLLNIRKKLSLILISMIIVVFPTAASTMFFRYTSIYYGLAILLSVIAAWEINRYKPLSLLAGAICICLSLGIYQAYLPLTIGIMVLLLFMQSAHPDADLILIIKRGIICCLTFAAGLILYFGTVKLSLWYYGTQLTDYRGISEMGKINIRELPLQVIKAWLSPIKLFTSDLYGLAPVRIFNLAYVILALLCLVSLAATLKIRRLSFPRALFSLALSALLPLAVNSIEIMCPSVYTLMVYQFVLVLILPIALFDNLELKPAQHFFMAAKKASIIISVFFIAAYAYYDNVNYAVVNATTRQTEAYWDTLISRIESAENFSTSLKWAFVGDISDPLIKNPWEKVPLYGGATADLFHGYSRNDWLKYYYGYNPDILDSDETSELTETKEVQAMPCYPDDGSIKVIDDTVVIKFSDES